MTPFEAVLLRCPDGHYEATTLADFTISDSPTTGNQCRRCWLRLTIVKTAWIVPGGRMLEEAS